MNHIVDRKWNDLVWPQVNLQSLNMGKKGYLFSFAYLYVFVNRNGTSMISLIIPPKDQVSRVAKMLADEFGTASNIKSRVNR